MTTWWPALKLKMGNWEYYSIRMTMSQVASNIKFAADIEDNPTLSSTIQREINKGRVKTQIVKYLSTNDSRFFNSIVVAALDGEPEWFEIPPDPNNETIKHFIKRYQDTFGVLTFDDTLNVYALDGQHRLFAIKELLERNNPDYSAPEGFANESINVIFLMPQKDQTIEAFRKDYRRIFSALNRHAKPVAKNTIIIIMMT